MLIYERLKQYALLMRLHKPIGMLLLLWPTLWALWLASGGHPNTKILLVFVVGVVLMRSAGCVLNDIADRHVDGHVRRTRNRPLAARKVSLKEAMMLVAGLSAVAFLLVLVCNALTIMLAFVAVALIFIYPLMKRFTHLPQVGLGAAFSWGVPMAFAAETGAIGVSAWFLFITSVIWPVIYDTMYAMADREDDRKIGVKSTAILFDQMDKFVIGLMQVLFIILLVIVGLMFELNSIYYLCLVPASLLFVYQQWLIKDRNEQKCFRAFLNNNWVGLIIFVGILLSYLQ